MLSNYWKKIISMLLVLVLLIQVTPLAVRAEEAYPENPTCDPQTGKSDLYEYTPFEGGMAGTAYLNNYLGTLHLDRTDLSLGGERMPVSIDFYYDESINPNSGAYGAGWTSTYAQTIRYNGSDDRYEYKNANGTMIYFVYSDCDGDTEIWTEDTQYGIGYTGLVLYRPSIEDYYDYSLIDLVSGDTHYSFTECGNLNRIQSGANQIQIGHNCNGHVIDYVTDTVGRKFDFSYTNGRLSSVTCKDSDGNVITSNGTAVSVSYSYTGVLLTGVTYANGDTVTYTYDSNLRITGMSNIDKCGYSFTYAENSVIDTVTAKAAIGTDAEATGAVTYYEQPENNAATITSEDTQQRYTFDGCGRTLSCELLMATTEAAAQGLDDSGYECVYGMTFTYDYVMDEEGNVTNTIIDVDVYDSEGMIEENSEDEEEESVAESEPIETEPDPYTYTEDEFGNILTETNTQGNLHQTTTYTYSDDGNYLTSMTDADGNTVQYHYNSNTGLLEYLIDANNVRTDYGYNAMRELQMVNLDPSNIAGSTAMAASYIYTQGRLTGLTYGAYTYQFAYDIWGNVVSVTMNGRPLVTYNYGDTAYKGQVQTLTYGNGQTVYYTYNALGQVTNVGYTNQPERFNYVYDTDGSLLMIEDNLMEQTTVYTETGYEIRTLNGSMIYSCSSDEDGKKTENVNGMTFQTTVDAEANSTAITDGSDGSLMNASRVYDAFDRLTRKNLTSGWVSTNSNYQYVTDNDGSTGNLVSNYSTYYLNATSQQTTLDFSYSYDGNGNITDIVRTERSGNVVPTPTPVPDDEPVTMILGGDRIVTSYAYDAAGQLLEAIDGETDHIYRYTYDNSGNITSAKTYVYDDDGNEVLSDSKTFSYSNGILASYNNGMIDVTYQTDAMGNPIRISDGGIVKTLSWGEGRMLLGVYTKVSNYSQYTYNADGLRTRKVVTVNDNTTTTEYVWGDNGLAGTIIYDATATTTVVPHYDGEGEAIGFTVTRVPTRQSSPSTTDTYTYVKNLQGDVLRILDSDGNAVVSYTYDPWGKPTVTGDEDLAALNPCSYRGYDYDEETGYYYLQSRHYDPQIGRFLNTDEVGYSVLSENFITYNLFTYCNNSPIIYSDPSGHLSAGSIIFGLLGFGIGSILAPVFADMLKLTGSARTLFIVGGVAAFTALGALLGKYAGKALVALYAKGGKFAKALNTALAKLIAKLVKGSLSSASGNGWKIKVGKVLLRIMSSGGGRTNYFRITLEGKGAMTLSGVLSSDQAQTHINITIKNIIKIIKLILKFK